MGRASATQARQAASAAIERDGDPTKERAASSALVPAFVFVALLAGCAQQPMHPAIAAALRDCQAEAARMYPDQSARGAATYQTDCTAFGNAVNCSTRQGASQTDWSALGANIGNALAFRQAVEQCMIAKGFVKQ